MATQLVDALTGEWRPEQYEDSYADELRDRIERKERGDDVVEAEPDEAPSKKVIDLAEALERSLGEASSKRRKPAKKRRAS